MADVNINLTKKVLKKLTTLEKEVLEIKKTLQNIEYHLTPEEYLEMMEAERFVKSGKYKRLAKLKELE
ncbi:hypothetical protein J7J90_01575 [Candidatus Micrarchaeota archaeon]|nr:hypothetical protein [Candidatus Micrarchaeota archaeon]